MKIKIKKIRCLQCSHQWIPRKEEIKKCPRCQSVWFDKPKKKIKNENNKKRDEK